MDKSLLKALANLYMAVENVQEQSERVMTQINRFKEEQMEKSFTEKTFKKFMEEYSL